MFLTEHSKMRFIERVDGVNLPKRNKQKFIEQYIKKAFKYGLTPDEINDPYLQQYMKSKLKQNVHFLNPTEITHYKGNLFLFRNRSCITILDVPEQAANSVNNVIYITKLKPYVNHLKEKQCVKKWLLENTKHLENTKDLKRCIINVPNNISYEYLMNRFPLKAVKYIKNDSNLKKVIYAANKKRNLIVKERYYFICALLLLIPKSQILKLQNVLKNNNDSIFTILNNKEISKKQLEVCYKQLFIILGGDLSPKYNTFKVENNTSYDIINDHFKNIINDYIKIIRDTFKNKI